jgi:hypothetical protein
LEAGKLSSKFVLLFALVTFNIISFRLNIFSVGNKRIDHIKISGEIKNEKE